MDPEQIYEEVLKEEQGKGVSGPVAEGRAKSARARAEAGSPHPKEPKWWAGAQPHLEGGEAAAPAEEEAPEAAPAEDEAPAAEAEQEAPAAAEPAEAEPAAEPAAAAEEEQAARPAPEEAPAAAPPPEPAPVPADQPAAAAAAPAEPARPAGVTHGTTTGTRVRPEDAVGTDAQFEGQQAMYERRKLIDDLVATGVPAVAAQETGRPRTPWLAILYLIIPIVVIAYLAGQESSEGSEPAPPPETTEGGDGGGGGTPALVASGTEWDTDTLTIPADGAEVEVTNEDPTVHNMSIYPDEQAALAKQDPLFQGEDVEGGATLTYEVDPIDPGTYTFICDYHTNMIGEVTVE